MRRINRKTEKRNSLLDKLQEESWQLELIVSGIVIFLLIGVLPELEELGRYFSTLTMGSSPYASLITTLWGFTGIAHYALIGMFLLHLVLRGMWIGAIGLRSVSGDFDHDQLDYPPRYGNFLRHRLGSFDDYIDRLERNASVTFSLAFLLFFAIFSLGLFFVTLVTGIFMLTLGDGSISSDDKEFIGPFWFKVIIVAIIAWTAIMLLAGLIYFIDFITFGWIKKRKWFGRIYYPVYRFLGWVTLARLYRPFYYNIIDNPFGKKLVRIYSALTFVAIMMTSVQTTPFENFAYSKNMRGVINAENYLNEKEGWQTGQNYQSPSLTGRYAEGNYHELFVPLFESRIKRSLKHRFPDLRPLAGSSIGFMNRMKLRDQDQLRVDSTLRALSAIHRVYLNDSLIADVPWRFYDHPLRKQPGLKYDIPVYDLPRGEYWVRLEYQKFSSDSLSWEKLATISFLR